MAAAMEAEEIVHLRTQTQAPCAEAKMEKLAPIRNAVRCAETWTPPFHGEQNSRETDDKIKTCGGNLFERTRGAHFPALESVGAAAQHGRVVAAAAPGEPRRGHATAIGRNQTENGKIPEAGHCATKRWA